MGRTGCYGGAGKDGPCDRMPLATQVDFEGAYWGSPRDRLIGVTKLIVDSG